MGYSNKTLQHRLVIQVTLGLLIFSIVAGIFTYQYSYKQQLDASLEFQNQLVRTVQSQAEVAAFVSNEEIGNEILNGLLTNPLLKAVRLESKELFRLERLAESQQLSEPDFAQGVIYPLFSPVDGKEEIGSLTVIRNNKHIRSEATKSSMAFTILLLFQLLMAAILIIYVSRKVISKPVAVLAKEVVSIKPGENCRINIEQIHTHDEIGMLSNSINALIDQAETALSQSAAAREVAEAANRARSEFLDNSGEGFLSFGADMIIAPEYSHECESIFEERLYESKKIGDLLFGKEPFDKKEGFEKTLDLIFNETLDLKKELYISLLPPIYQIGEKHIRAKYKLISNDTKMMLILTDITREKVLEQHVENERKRLKFVIAAVRETRDFFAIIDELTHFKTKSLPHIISRFYQHGICNQKSFDKTEIKSDNREALYEIYRNIHTFKGLFAQQEFLSFPEFLHQMESRLSVIIGKVTGAVVDEKDAECYINEIQSFAQDFQNETVLEQDLVIIRAFLGDEFIERRGDVVISSELASRLESMAISLINKMGENIDNETLAILEEVKLLRYVDIKSLLTPHVEGALRLAERLGKYVNPFKVEGDEIKVHPDRFTPFVRSLVNVFRNAVDHAIEEPDKRLETQKDEYATILCSVREIQESDGSKKYVEVSISDDGKGIDISAIKRKVAKMRLIKAQDELDVMPESEIIQLIFLDDFSTKSSVDAMSGRGMGLSAVKKELENLNGRVEIETEIGKGTNFRFYIPLEIQ
ncbi:MAG: hypothetical protein HQK68_02640 [Desulfamplus sp.]|nr:hypothetical protein [Desulfamplus sp.]